jgi:dynein heavy chain 2
MKQNDKRIDFLVSNIKSICQVTDEKFIKDEFLNSIDTEIFLDDINTVVLIVSLLSTDNVIISSNVSSITKSESHNENSSNLLFVKRTIEHLTPDNINKCLHIQTISGPLFDGIYHSLHNIWNPNILNDMNKMPEGLNDNRLIRVKQILSELDNELKTVKNVNNISDTDIDYFSNIYDITDEIQFWYKRKSNRNANNADKIIDNNFNILGTLGYMNLDAIDLHSIIDLIEKTQDSLNLIWETSIEDHDGNITFPYTQRRMTHVFDCIGGTLIRYIQKQLSSVDIWRSTSNDVKQKLIISIDICDHWSNLTSTLTSNFWLNETNETISRNKDRSDLKWKGNKHEDINCKRYKNRLSEILQIRLITDELHKLLTKEEMPTHQLNTFYDHLDIIQPISFNPYVEPQIINSSTLSSANEKEDDEELIKESSSSWTKAITEFEELIDPITITSFRRIISSILNRPQLLLNEFLKYKTLLKRSNILRSLLPERETLLALLKKLIKNIDNSIDHIDNSKNDNSLNGNFLSPCITKIVLLKQLETKVNAILSTGIDILYDLSGFREFQKQCDEISMKSSAESSWLFDNWKKDIQATLNDNDELYNLNGSLMVWKDGILIVNFSNELIRLIHEVRQLKELGYEITGSNKKRENKNNVNILDKAIEAEKFYQYGITLKKTANFYNTLSDKMIDVQEQLLLGSLASFEKVLKSKPSSSNSHNDEISWNNPVEFENYINNLEIAKNILEIENRELTKVHELLSEYTVQLMNIDLLKQPGIWKAKWRTIKNTISVIKNKYNEKDSKMWILHWDNQIYKALEANYQSGLVHLNNNLSEIKIDIVYNNGKLEFSPTLEEVRQVYYNEINKFLTIPKNFPGFDNAYIYKRMGSYNKKRLLQVYQKSEILLSKLTTVIDKYTDTIWIKPSECNNLESYFAANINDINDYIKQFKGLKLKRKDIDKILDNEKIECFNINLLTFKTYLEDLLQRYSNTLIISLKNNIIFDFDKVLDFFETSNKRLNTLPHNIEEISIAKNEWKNINNIKESIKLVSKSCLDKKKILETYSLGSNIDITEITKAMHNLDNNWEDFDFSLEAFEDIIEEQKENIKKTIEVDHEKINGNIDKIYNRWKQLKPSEIKDWNNLKDITKIIVSLEDWKSQLSEIQATSNQLIDSFLAFNLAIPRFDNLDFLSEDISRVCKSWDLYKEYNDEIQIICSQDWSVFSINVYTLYDFAIKWDESLKVNFLNNTFDNVIEHIFNNIDKIKKSIPALKYCRGDNFGDDHWIELLQKQMRLNKDINKRNLKVKHFISKLDILIEPKTLAFVKNLQARSLGEIQIKEALFELKQWEQSSEIKLLTTKESGRSIPLIKEWKDLFLEMGDKQSLLISLKESPFFKLFLDQGLLLEKKINTLDTVLKDLNIIQRKWIYLEPIFNRGALPNEQKRFKEVDNKFIDIMNAINKNTKLFSLANNEVHISKGDTMTNLCGNLSQMLETLEKCQKALTNFLEEKRENMPRFYFIGDDDLLEILGQSKNPLVIQSHLKKLFQGIHKVKFGDDTHKTITSMISSSNEVVDFINPIMINEKIELWLTDLVDEMRHTLKKLLLNCLNDFDIIKFPSQILCLAQSINFTNDMEVVLNNSNTKANLVALHKKYSATLTEYTSFDLSGDPLVQIKIKSLIFDLVHFIDVIEQLQKTDVNNINDWKWQKQLRNYLVDGVAIIRMHDAEFDYTYEYQGNAPKLVHTPLTDKCYLTLTQGMHMGFGGNPYGPAGTGKTESVKALAGAFGRQVLVFNCDEALESTSMVRIFVGIIKCGAWGCFDEFNRLKEDQLSAISQQIQIIQDSIKLKITPIVLLEKTIDVDFNSGIFVTLNPAGKGYGGRSKLPDNLKALFRPVAMGAPDNELIAEVSLITEGFTESKKLASKVVSLFNLSKQLLSPQQHYDWGLRALKAVLNSGGRIIQLYKESNQTLTAEVEEEILIKALRVNTLPKLTFSDTSKYLLLINDVFPGVLSSDVTEMELETAIKDIIKTKPYFFVEDNIQIKKILQLKESLNQRMGCIIVGPSGSGKSSLWNVLKSAMIKCGQPVSTYVMNPKSMHRDRLLGFMDLDTREWTDGVLTDAARKVVKESPDVQCWIICDGDVDPEWIESLNSVLDDNHLLTLPNGERINFGSNVNFIFETHDLKYASPATVSRMGMIYLSDEDFDVKRLITKWLASFNPDKRMEMQSWIDESFYKALDYVISICSYVIDTTLVGTIMNALVQIKHCKNKQEYICCLIRGIGGNISIIQRENLGKLIFEWMGERIPDMGNALDYYGADGIITPFQLDNSSLEFEGTNISDLGVATVVPTVSIQRALATLENLIVENEPFILVGPEGCGKSMIIKQAFKKKKNIHFATIHCNAQTTSDDVINKIIQTSSLYSAPDGRVYRPRDCDRLVLYLKNINLPRPDMYDTCQLIAFLQQLITFGGFYNAELEFLKIEKIQIVCSITAATTVGRHQLSTRFTAAARIIVIDYADVTELITVYDSFLSVVFKQIKLCNSNWSIDSERYKISNFIIEVYQKVREKFTVDDRKHYLFTPRDITLLIRNISRYFNNDGSENDGNDMLDVLVNECNRIFRDRLIDSDSCRQFDQIVVTTLYNNFKYSYNSNNDCHITSLISSRGNKVSDTGITNKNIVGSSLKRMPKDDFHKLVSQGVVYYEREEKNLNILLFPDFLNQITYVDRIISSYGGHILMAGSSGIGRRNSVIITAYMIGYEFYSPSISRNYDVKHFHNDIKTVLNTAGIKGEHIIFFIEDFQIISESFLEIINSLLSSGEVSGLYTNEELEPLLVPLREKMQEEGIYHNVYDFFISRIRKYMHIVLCMDPSHNEFLYRCESNPALYTHCSIIWANEWKVDTLKFIPKLLEGVKDFMFQNKQQISGNNEAKEEGKNEGKHRDSRDSKDIKEEIVNIDVLIEMIISIHTSMLKYDASPRDYLSFLNTWLNLYSLKKLELKNELSHLDAGLSKLNTATEVVNELKINTKNNEVKLKIAQTAADEAMNNISNALVEVNERRNETSQIKRNVANNELATQQRKKEIEVELSEIQPILDEAKSAVGQIKSEHLNEIRSLNTPPEAIADVFGAVLTLLGVNDLSWGSMKKFLSNRGVKDDIMNYDGKRINPDLRKTVSKLIRKKPQSFEAENIRRVSIAAAPFASWVKANIQYSLVIEKIEPLEDELNEEIKKLEISQRHLKKCEDELAEIDEKVNELKREFSERTAETERLKNNLSITEETLNKAEGLINQLGGEQTRWNLQAKQLINDLSILPIKMLLAAGFNTYLAKMPEDVRINIISIWQDITSIKSFNYKSLMSSESILLQWKSLGLPSDNLSQENSLVITSISDRIPFIIDPASAATSWLKSILSNDVNRPLETVMQHDERFTNLIELSVRFGKSLLILEVDTVESMLYPLCRRDFIHQGPRYVVNIGDKLVDYNENFRMYLVTRNPTPDLAPDAASLVIQINFTVTRSGLEGQLLGIALQHEQPELEKIKSEMLRKEEDFKIQIDGLEKDLLQALATAEGNLLENTALISTLTRTKEKSAEIEESLIQSAETSLKLDEQREVYRPFAHTGSNLFFLIKSLKSINHMYQFSLNAFLDLFKQTLNENFESTRNIEERLVKLDSNLIIRVLYFIGRALFKSDRPMFALHLVKSMYHDQIQSKEWDVFTGSLISNSIDGKPRGFPSWLPSERESQFKLLQENLPHLMQTLDLENISKWQRFSTSIEAERDIPLLRGISLFQKVLIIQAFRPDRLMSAILQFCTDILHIDTISPPPLSLSVMLDESHSYTPIILISSPGADASKELQEFASKTVGIEKYDELSLGGGQQDKALTLLHQASANGTWLCFQNIHLVITWLPLLEKELSSLEPHPSFRLWLTSEPHHKFPSILLQNSLKATFESPPGIKKNMQRTFDSWGVDLFDDNAIRSKLLFLLACFHAIIQERRTFIPQGWTKFYEFSYGDIRAGSYMIDSLANSYNADEGFDWEAIFGLMEDAIYGGRIDNFNDIKILKSYLKIFFSDDLISEKSAGLEIIAGTPLRMPSSPKPDFNSFLRVISQLPDIDSPYFFGLPDNIERSLQRSNSNNVIKQLKSLSSLNNETLKFDKNIWRLQLSNILDQWKHFATTTPGLISKKKETLSTNSSSNANLSDPIDDFIIMEYDFSGELCNIVDSSLNELKKILYGTGLLTPLIFNIGKCLLQDTIPIEWEKHWDGIDKPQKWISELVRKRISLMKLKLQITKGILQSGDAISLGDFFRPSIFINALRQQTARKLNIAIDKVYMISSFEKGGGEVKHSCEISCEISGIMLQGALFQADALQESSSDAFELNPIPNVYIGFTKNNPQANNDQNTSNYRGKKKDIVYVSTPLYISSSRNEYIVDIHMPSECNADKWILTGTALFLNSE